MENGIMQDIIDLKWELHCRRLIMRLLMKLAKCKHEAHEAEDGFWRCISVMFFQKLLPQKYIKAHAPHLFELIWEEKSRDIFPIEEAKMSYITSLLVLNHCQYKPNM